jgi:hypothetical protein
MTDANIAFLKAGRHIMTVMKRWSENLSSNRVENSSTAIPRNNSEVHQGPRYDRYDAGEFKTLDNHPCLLFREPAVILAPPEAILEVSAIFAGTSTTETSRSTGKSAMPVARSATRSSGSAPAAAAPSEPVSSSPLLDVECLRHPELHLANQNDETNVIVRIWIIRSQRAVVLGVSTQCTTTLLVFF